MTKKTLTITALTALAIIAGFLWFAQNQNATEVTQDNNSTTITPESSMQVVTTVEKKEENAENSNIAINDDSTQDIDTSDWETYVNEGCNFEIKIPQDWFVSRDSNCGKVLNNTPKEQDEAYEGIEIMQLNGILQNSPSPYYISIIPFFGDSRQTIENKMWLANTNKKLIEVTSNQIEISQYVDVTKKDVALSRKYMLSYEQSERKFVVDFLVWDIFTSTNDVQYEAYKKIFDGIMQSFKFTN